MCLFDSHRLHSRCATGRQLLQYVDQVIKDVRSEEDGPSQSKMKSHIKPVNKMTTRKKNVAL